MSGLIVLFWFVGGGIALRYLVSQDISSPCHPELTTIPRLRSCSSASCHVCMFCGISSVSIYASIVHVKPSKPPKDDTLARKVNTSDASIFAKQFGCCPSRGMTIHRPFFCIGSYVLTWLNHSLGLPMAYCCLRLLCTGHCYRLAGVQGAIFYAYGI